jgi:hypothetical protein
LHPEVCLVRSSFASFTCKDLAQLLTALISLRPMRRSCEVPATSSAAILWRLPLLGSYLTDAYNGDIRCRKEISDRLGHDKRQGFHARKVMESYQTWLERVRKWRSFGYTDIRFCYASLFDDGVQYVYTIVERIHT